MNDMKHLCAILVAAAALAGCAGADFKRPDDAAVRVGSSTRADVYRSMGGEPRNTGEVTTNDKQIKTSTYAYANAVGEPAAKDVVPGRSQAFSFYNDTLVGRQFLSSFKEDSSDFDDTKVPQIVKGKSTRADVLALLGKPSGEAVYPVVKQQGDTAALYGYFQMKGTVFNAKFYRKSLLVSFDARGVVSDVTLTVSGER